MPEKTAFAEWVVLELMGHRRLGGWLTEQEIAGAAYLRLDIPEVDGQPAATQFYGSAAVYAITPVTEEMARAVAASNRPQPVNRWELPQLPAPKAEPAIEDRQCPCCHRGTLRCDDGVYLCPECGSEYTIEDLNEVVPF